MSDFSRHNTASCPRCKVVFSRDDGIPCDCFAEEFAMDDLYEEYEDQMERGEIDPDMSFDDWREDR